MRFLKYFSIFLIIAGIIFYLGMNTRKYQVMSGKTMGTYYNIKIKTPKENNLLHNTIKAELQRINEQMSVFDSTSEISLINRSESTGWIDMSPELSEVMKEAYAVYKESNGAFDPTVGKLIDLWGFGVTSTKSIPSEEEINEVMKYTGFDKIKFNHNFTQLKKLNPNVYINLSALAKGYGVDRIAGMLSKIGYKDYVVEIGGEVVTSGKRDEYTNGWNIGVSKPNDRNSENAFIVTLKDYAVATSGDYRNFFEYEGKRYSHTISPQNGYPVEHNLASATVFNKQCMVADAYATALMSMGEEKGLRFANRNKLAAILFVRDSNNNIVALVSNEAKKLLDD